MAQPDFNVVRLRVKPRQRGRVVAKRKRTQTDDISESPVVQVTEEKTGKLVDGKVIKVVKADEPFSHIKLEDGTRNNDEN